MKNAHFPCTKPSYLSYVFQMVGDWYSFLYSLLSWTSGQHHQPSHSLQKVSLTIFSPSILVLFLRSMQSVFNHLLACLCTADSLFLISNICTLPVHFGLTNTFIVFVFPFFESFCHFSYSASIFLIVAITVERWQV